MWCFVFVVPQLALDYAFISFSLFLGPEHRMVRGPIVTQGIIIMLHL